MIVKVTQYMRPKGRPVVLNLKVPYRCQEKYKEICELGLKLTCEQLTNGEVSQAIMSEDGFDYDIKLTKGAELEENRQQMIDMILAFDQEKYWKMKAVFEGQNEATS